LSVDILCLFRCFVPIDEINTVHASIYYEFYFVYTVHDVFSVVLLHVVFSIVLLKSLNV